MKIIFIICILILVFCSNIIADDFVYDSHGRKDPFSLPILNTGNTADMEAIAGVKLEGIIWDADNPIAVINGKVVVVGNEISGAKVLEINENEVIFDANGQNVKIKLWKKEEGDI